jgi:hypothetical protein
MTTNDYNTGQTIFLCCFLFAELPSQLISKRLGPDRWIPIQMVAWSLVAACQAFLKTRSGYLGLRALLGLLEGGFIPDTILFLSFFYKSSELPKRLTCFWVSYTITTIIGAFLAFGLLHIKDSNGGGSWRYLFAYEGLLTGVIGIIAAFWMPASPTQTKGGFRGKDGWFTEHEEKIMVNRVIRDDPSKGSMHNRQAVTPRLLWDSLKDYHMWPIYILGFVWMIPYTPEANYLTLQLRSQGFTTFQTNLLTIPAAIVSITTMIATTWLAERTNQRLLFGAAIEVWYLVLLIALQTLPEKSMPWPRFAILTLIVGGPSLHPVLVALTSRNAGSVRTRTVASALYNMSVQVSSIAAANVLHHLHSFYSPQIPVLLNSTAGIPDRRSAVLQKWQQSAHRAGSGQHLPVHLGQSLLRLEKQVWQFMDLTPSRMYTDRSRQNKAKWDALSSEQRESYLRENPVMTNKR